MVRLKVILPAAGVVAGFALGCGGSDGGSTARATPTATATQAPAEASATATPAAQRRRGMRLVRVGTFNAPVYVTAPRGDRSVQFVVEQGGRIMVVRGGRKRSRPFLDISG